MKRINRLLAIMLALSMLATGFCYALDDVEDDTNQDLVKFSSKVEKTLFKTSGLKDYKKPKTPAFTATKMELQEVFPEIAEDPDEVEGQSTTDDPNPTSGDESWVDPASSEYTDYYSDDEGEEEEYEPVYEWVEVPDEDHMTTNQERDEYLHKLADKSPYVYMYYLDKAKTTPVIFVTAENLTYASAIEDAARKLGSSDKVNIFYQAQIHGNEPAGGEGCLYFLERIVKDKTIEEIVKSVNMFIIPCANPQAAEESLRRSSTDSRNPNRDSLAVQNEYTQLVHPLYNIIMPEVFLDSHECQSNFGLDPSIKSDYFNDLLVLSSMGMNIPLKTQALSDNLEAKIVSGCRSAGLRVADYDRATLSASLSRQYYALYGSASILIESTGINLGKAHYARRTYSHYKAVKCAVDYICKYSANIKKNIADARAKIVKTNSKFSKTNMVVIEHRTGTYDTRYQQLYSLSSGSKVRTVIHRAFRYDEPKVYRPIPTAYIVPKSAAGTSKMLKVLNYNGIKYEEVYGWNSLEVTGYEGTKKATTLKNPEQKSFGSGYYRIPTAQVGGMIVCALFEPDFEYTSGVKASFVSQDILKIGEVYRYCK